MTSITPLIAGWILDLIFGDPEKMPHPVVLFGKLISAGEQRLNRGSRRKLRGACLAVALIILTYIITAALIELSYYLNIIVGIIVTTLIIFACLAGTTLIREVRNVFLALDRSLDDGRRQVARIVGRDTSQLSAREVRTAALETLAENLSDGVIAPLFWLALLGAPGMMAYKMVNTLDSMVGYRTERYRDFGCIAANIDDIANFIPARLTAMLMIFAAWMLKIADIKKPQPHLSLCGMFRFVMKYGNRHASPNSGWPESALASALDCRFGGPHYYFGEYFYKPFIGENPRELTTADMRLAVKINRTAEIIAVALVVAAYLALLSL